MYVCIFTLTQLNCTRSDLGIYAHFDKIQCAGIVGLAGDYNLYLFKIHFIVFLTPTSLCMNDNDKDLGNHGPLQPHLFWAAKFK